MKASGHGVAAGFLSVIHGSIGAAHQSLPIAAVGVELSDTRTDRELDWPGFEGHFELLNGLPHPFGSGDTGGCGGIREEDGKLFASDAGQQILGAEHLFCRADQGLEGAISGGMPSRVVEVLEVVDVDNDHAEWMIMAKAARSFSLGRLFHRSAIQRSGEGVSAGLLGQLSLQLRYQEPEIAHHHDCGQKGPGGQ